MAFRFIIVDDDNYKLVGTDDEALARQYAEDVLVYDTQEGKSLNDDGSGEDEAIGEAPAIDNLDSGDVPEED